MASRYTGRGRQQQIPQQGMTGETQHASVATPQRTVRRRRRMVSGTTTGHASQATPATGVSTGFSNTGTNTGPLYRNLTNRFQRALGAYWEIGEACGLTENQIVDAVKAYGSGI
jgi:hypothetical protein